MTIIAYLLSVSIHYILQIVLNWMTMIYFDHFLPIVPGEGRYCGPGWPEQLKIIEKY